MLNRNFNQSLFTVILLSLFGVSYVDFISPFSPINQGLAQTVNPSKTKADQHMEEGIKLYRSSQYLPALKSWEESLKLYREIGDLSGVGDSLLNIGNVYYSLGEYQKALEFYQQSLLIKKEIKDQVGVGNSLQNLGNVYRGLGDYQKALETYQQSFQIYEEIGESSHLSGPLLGMGSIYNSLGQYQKALEAYQESLKIAQERKDRFGESKALNNIGIVYSNLGEYSKALEYLQEALMIKKAIGDDSGVGNSLGHIGFAYYSLAEYKTALKYYEQALKIYQEIGDRSGLSQALNAMGDVYKSLEEYPKALDYYEQSLQITKEIGYRTGMSYSLHEIGHVYQGLGEHQKALDYYHQSLKIRREIGRLSEEAETLRDIGIVYATLKNYSASEPYLLAAVDILGELRTGLNDQNKISIFETQKLSYSWLESVLVAQNKTEQALEVSEKGRARALMELLSYRLGNISQIQPPTLEEIKAISQRKNATLVEYSIIADKLLIWVVQPTGKITLRQGDLTAETLRKMAESGRIAAATGRSKLLIEKSVITQLVRGTHDQLRFSSKKVQSTISNLQELHQLLIQPIEDLLPKNPQDHVVFIPQESLFLVPFVALQNAQGQYLIEKHTIFTASSIQHLELSGQLLQKNQQTHRTDSLIVGVPRKSVILGNPAPMPKIMSRNGTLQQLADLTGAEDEAKAIAQLLNTQAFLGNQATKKLVLTQLSQAKIIHLATHGLLDDLGTGIPGALAFAPSEKDNGLLTSSEIFDLKLNAELVVLSACNTGLGKLTGDGVIGLSRAFLSAGVPSIIVSLWSVNDISTAFLMTQFYQNWQGGKMDKAQALRQAMLATLQKYPSPSNWAGFTLIGETK